MSMRKNQTSFSPSSSSISSNTTGTCTSSASPSLSPTPPPDIYDNARGTMLCMMSELMPTILTTPSRAYAFGTTVPTIVMSIVLYLFVVRFVMAFLMGIDVTDRRNAMLTMATVIIVVVLCQVAFYMYLSNILLHNRQEPLPKAVNAMNKLIEEKRVLLDDPDYDVYLPPPFSSSSPNGENGGTRDDEEVEWGVVLFPGALVSKRAYARVASKLSHRGGMVVAVVNTEPYRLPTFIFPTTNSRFVTNVLMKRIASSSAMPRPRRWAVCGHSMGADVALRVGNDLNENNIIAKIVLWGKFRQTDNMRQCRKTPLDVILINASNDGFYFADRKARDDFFSKMPADMKYREIEGGNHSGFADYGKQRFPKEDGERTIPVEQQHDEIVRETVDFLSSS